MLHKAGRGIALNEEFMGHNKILCSKALVAGPIKTSDDAMQRNFQ